MRKKLLALLMCATMVLGTAVTASAATTKGDAENVFKADKNFKNFFAEYYPTDSIVKDSAYNGKNGTVEYGYIDAVNGLADEYKPVVVYKAGDKLNGTTKNEYYAATHVDNALDANGDVKELKITQNAANPSVSSVELAAKKAVADAGFATGLYAVEVTDNLGLAKQIVTVDAATGVVNATEGYVTNTKKWVKYPQADVTLVKASKSILKSTDENAYGTIYSNISAATELADDVDAVMSAIDAGLFSKNAVAVKVTAYLQGTVATEDLGLEKTNIYNGNAKLLYNIDKLQAGKYTFDSDLISRTGFKDAAAVNVFQPTLAKTKFDTELGTLVKDFVKVATVEVGKTITFDNDATFVEGVFVFDKGELAAEPEADKNDGVSDTATTDNTTSPKTGDVAPIAALAVVMMGAFGAMVVASKKRA